MTETAQVIALVVGGLNLLAGAVAGALWWRVEPRSWAWAPIRVGQAAAVAQAVAAGVFAVGGMKPGDGLYWLYALLPVAVSFVAEQLRLLAAQVVLDARGLEDAQAVGRLDPDDQRSIVLQIVRRELGVMAAAALVIAFLAWRAWLTV